MKKEPIYARIKKAIDDRGHDCKAVFIGINEWQQLGALCKKWGHDWPPGGDNYSPQNNEAMRATFLNMKIYRVDAADHLDAI